MRYGIPSALCASLSVIGWSSTADASLDACGNIHVEVSAQCKVEVGGGCKSKCTPINFVTTCRTKRYNACRKECTVQPPEVDCQANCAGECDASCSGDLGRIECEASCHGDCMVDCKSYCEATETQTDCTGSCEATCGGECSASCAAVPPSASCEAYCSASCDGSCNITAPYIECQVKCQEREYQECETEMQGGCETQCEAPEGALFCDDQFVDHGGQMRECVDSLNDLLTGQVDVSATSTLRYECDERDRCRLIIGGSVSTGCATAPPGASGGLALALLLLGALVISRSGRPRR